MNKKRNNRNLKSLASEFAFLNNKKANLELF